MKTATSRLSVTRATLLAAAQLACSAPLFGATGSWTNNGTTGLTWPTATSWAGSVIPNGVGDTANFTNDITANRLISLSSDKTVGTLNIGDSATGFVNFTLNAGSGSPLNTTLVLDQTGVADATIAVPVVGGVGANSIVTPYLLLKDNLVISTAFADSTTTQLNLNTIIRDDDGTFSITKTGSGIIQLSGNNTYKGGTTLSAGRINVNNVRAFGTGAVTVQSGGQAFINTASAANNFSIAGTGYSNSIDLAAQAGAVRFANNRVMTGNLTIAGNARIGGDAAAVGFLDGTLGGSADLEINGPTTTTGGITLLRGGSGFTGALSLARGSFQFNSSLGGSLSAAPVAAATVTLGTGTALGGSLTLDSTAAPVTLRNVKGTLAITGNLSLTGATPVSLASTPPAGTTTLTLMTYASQTGAGSLTFDATGYRGTPTLTVGPTTATISGLQGATRTWNAAANGTWDVGTSANWVEGDNKFFQADAVVFGNTAVGTVTLVGTVAPHSVTFTNTGTNDYSITGTGGIDGASGGIIKNGDAWLTLGGENTFTGPVSVNAGRLVIGSQRGLGFTSGVTVATGASLDLNGISTLAGSRSYDLTLAGPGDGTSPALTNGGPPFTFTGSPSSGIRNITHTADATIGGTSGKTFDLGGGGTIDGGGFTLTKTGANQIYLMGLAKNLNTVVEEGTLTGFGPDPFGTTLRIKPGAIAQAGNSGYYTSNLILDSGAILEHSGGIESIWTGSFTAAGNLTLSNVNTTTTSLQIPSGFSVPGNLTKSNGGLVTLLGTVDVAGSVTIGGGILALGNGGSGGSVGSTAPITLSGTNPNLTINRSSALAVPNLISGAGSLSKSGTGTVTLTADNSYSANTTVNAGTLLVNGTQTGLGNTNVVGGATLGGTGTLPGAVNILSGATLAPGTSIGTFTTGSTGKTTTVTGTLRIEFNGSASPATDVLVAKDALVLGAASILDFDATGSALTAPVYIVATYTTLTGTFATVTDLPAGYKLASNYDNGVTTTNLALVKLTPFDLWISGFFPAVTDLAIVGPNADPDGDGQSNAVEFALGGTPNSGSGLAKIHTFTADSDDADSNKELLLTIAVRSGTPPFAGSPSPSAIMDGFTSTLQGSLNLAAFTSAVSPVAPFTTGLPAAPAGYEYRTFSLDGSDGLPAKGFLRVQVTP